MRVGRDAKSGGQSVTSITSWLSRPANIPVLAVVSFVSGYLGVALLDACDGFSIDSAAGLGLGGISFISGASACTSAMGAVLESDLFWPVRVVLVLLLLGAFLGGGALLVLLYAMGFAWCD